MTAETSPSVFKKDTTSVEKTATIPRLPIIISKLTICLRTGKFTTVSASAVVNPAPLNADSDWKRAMESGKPVKRNATEAIRMIKTEMLSNTKREIAAPI